MGGESWLHSEYRDLMLRLDAEPPDGFRLLSVELRTGDGTAVSGELGYCIGRVYTSLTGFHGKDRRE